MHRAPLCNEVFLYLFIQLIEKHSTKEVLLFYKEVSPGLQRAAYSVQLFSPIDFSYIYNKHAG
ncbi:hypothetical protein SY85_08485 [Flavisolibacter tropicus]|uniref:Uncharacterized protein n=1 Tax=Flavisolibacter tropicus TaxID=1492898 RepID=A0A172TU52_9BACT|nr:hypothetical protein SY85_08485 [Flavisolibacter tropicus]